MTDSKFNDFMEQTRKRTESQAPAAPAAAAPQPTPQLAAAAPAPTPAKRGRPAGGKRQNPDYEQVAAYIPKSLYKQVRLRLMQMEPEGEFSHLVEVLLTRWMQQGPK